MYQDRKKLFYGGGGEGGDWVKMSVKKLKKKTLAKTP